MRGFAILGLFSIIYLLLMILLQETSAEPRGVDQEELQKSTRPDEPALQQHIAEENSQTVPNSPKDYKGHVPDIKTTDTNNVITPESPLTEKKKPCNKNKTKAPQVRATEQNSSNPIVNMFQVTDPSTMNMLDAAYGSYSGDDQCIRKSFCMMGNYAKDFPGRDLLFIFMGGYIPPAYTLYYDIFRSSALYGQNCNVYVCLVQESNEVSPPR